MSRFAIVAVFACTAFTTTGCTRDTKGSLQFDPVKACKALVLAAPTIEAAKHAALDAGAKPAAVDHAATVAHDLAEFATAICATTAT